MGDYALLFISLFSGHLNSFYVIESIILYVKFPIGDKSKIL